MLQAIAIAFARRSTREDQPCKLMLSKPVRCPRTQDLQTSHGERRVLRCPRLVVVVKLVLHTYIHKYIPAYRHTHTYMYMFMYVHASILLDVHALGHQWCLLKLKLPRAIMLKSVC